MKWVTKEIIGGYPLKRKVKPDDFETEVKKELKQLFNHVWQVIQKGIKKYFA